MRKATLSAGIAVIALAASPCFAQDLLKGAASSIESQARSAATKATNDAINRGATAMGLKPADKSTDSAKQAKAGDSKPTYSAGPSSSDSTTKSDPSDAEQ